MIELFVTVVACVNDGCDIRRLSVDGRRYAGRYGTAAKWVRVRQPARVISLETFRR